MLMKSPQTERVVELKFPSELGFEKVARDAAAAVAQKMNFSPDRIEDLKTAVGEACINAIEHGNRHDVGKQVEIILAMNNTKLSIMIKDHGLGGIPEVAQKVLSITDRVEGLLPPRGMGIFIIEQLMDEAGFMEPPPGEQGNLFRMVIYKSTT